MRRRRLVFSTKAEQLHWLRKAANKGDPDASYLYGALLWDGKEMKRNVHKARIYLKRSLELGTNYKREAKWKLGLAYLDPLYQNYHSRYRESHSLSFQGKRLLKQAAEDGWIPAAVDLGAKLIEGKWLERDPEQGEYWLQKAIDQGDDRAKSYLATFYLKNWTVEQNSSKGIEMFEQEVKRGNRFALCEYGWHLLEVSWRLEDHEKLKQETRRGESYLLEAIDQGSTQAMAYLGDKLVHGMCHRKRDLTEALRLLSQAATAKNAYAMRTLAIHILEGNLPEASSNKEKWRKKAVLFLHKAAEMGDDQAMVELGRRYQYGFRLPKNLYQALFWYHLASIYQNEEGKREFDYLNQKMMLHWLKKAAESGDVEAMYELGFRSVYEIGDAVDPPFAGERWLKKAGEKGLEDAKRTFDRIRHTLPM